MKNEIREIISDYAGINQDEVKSEQDLFEDLKIDKITLFSIAMDVEEKFDIELPDEDVKKLRTVKDLENCAYNKRVEAAVSTGSFILPLANSKSGKIDMPTKQENRNKL